MIVNFNEQCGKYQTINKVTGETQPSYRDGSPLRKFKSLYSGSDYKKRREYEKNLCPKTLYKSNFKIEYPHRHTKTLQKIDMKPLKKQYSTKTLQQSNKYLISSIKHSETGQFERKMKQYSQKCRPTPNYTVHKGYYDNKQNIQLPKLNKKSNTILKHKNNLQTISKNEKQASTINLPAILQQKDQIQRQRRIFYRYHSQYAFKKDQKREEELKQRKINMKILQKQYLANSEKLTNKVYQ